MYTSESMSIPALYLIHLLRHCWFGIKTDLEILEKFPSRPMEECQLILFENIFQLNWNQKLLNYVNCVI